MTDNEIIKALECCNNGWCDVRCPYYGREDIADCREQSGADQLDLINRQKAEIERLQAYYDDVQSAIYSFREDHAKVKFFKGEIKAEAVKEFAERLRKKLIDGGLYPVFVKNKIEETKKEMEGGA